MLENSTGSTVRFNSNLQVLEDYIDRDKKFLASIHDPFALAIMREKNYNAITEIQEKEFRDAALHCSYAMKDDYPWGTIINADGKEDVVCRCINVDCANFNNCRSDFDESELEVNKGNIIAESQVEKRLSAMNSVSQHQENEAPNALYELLNANPKEKPEETSIRKEEPVTQRINRNVEKNKEKDLPVMHQESLADETKTVIPASFASFVEVEQKDIIEDIPEERTIVNAGPGTGKTWTLIEKIKYMLSVEEVDPENILVLCFSRAAVEVVRKRLQDAANNEELPLNWHEVDVRTFDSFATYVLAWAQENMPELLTAGFKLEVADYDARIAETVKVIRAYKDLLTEYKHIIVDEVQDLVGIRAEMVLSLLNNLPETCGFTILGDACQSLYDYLAEKDNSVMASQQFYDHIFAKFSNANYCTLTHNYRQTDAFGSLLAPYREAILHGDAASRRAEAKKLSSMISTSDVNLKDFSQEAVAKFSKAGTLGILTRTNGQALQISSWLHTAGVDHVLQKPAGSQDLAAWIARVLMNTESDVTNQHEFEKIFVSLYPEKADCVEIYWNALISTQKDQTERYYEIEKLLHGLLNNARNPLLFDEPTEKNTDIVVSNIHRAKGREFDTVLVLEDVLDALTEDDCDDILEHKVCYVSLTRPRKTIEKVSLKSKPIYTLDNEFRRCFKSGGFLKKIYLSHFEIGDAKDVNSRSFAEDEQIQSHIKKIAKGTRLKLLKCPEGTRNYVVYKIVTEEDERTILGYTTSFFASGMKNAIQRIFKTQKNIDYRYYPNKFTDVYFDGLITCISISTKEIPGAKKIGDVYMWYGMSVSGFARMEKDKY